MKKVFAILTLFTISYTSNAQDEKEMGDERKGGFKKENLFTGGSIELSFANSTFVIGASPVIGYSINKWLDAGIVANFSYYTNRHVTYYDPYTGFYFNSDDKQKQTILGPGAFVKFYPLRFLSVQAQTEVNFISEKFIYADGYPTERAKYTVPSLLLGVGYCGGREGVGDLFYYFSLSVDVLKDKNSPYVEQISNGKVNMLPIIRAGIQVPLFQGGRR